MADVSFMFMIKYICNNLMKNIARLKLWDMYYESSILSPLFLSLCLSLPFSYCLSPSLLPPSLLFANKSNRIYYFFFHLSTHNMLSHSLNILQEYSFCWLYGIQLTGYDSLLKTISIFNIYIVSKINGVIISTALNFHPYV